MDERLRAALTRGFQAYMTGWSTPSRDCAKYGIDVTELSPDRRELFLTFTFRAGYQFCCCQPACHHGLVLDSDFARLHECFRREGADVGRPLVIHMRVVCERGTMFDGFASDAMEFVDDCDEASALKDDE